MGCPLIPIKDIIISLSLTIISSIFGGQKLKDDSIDRTLSSQ